MVSSPDPLTHGPGQSLATHRIGQHSTARWASEVIDLEPEVGAVRRDHEGNGHVEVLPPQKPHGLSRPRTSFCSGSPNLSVLSIWTKRASRPAAERQDIDDQEDVLCGDEGPLGMQCSDARRASIWLQAWGRRHRPPPRHSTCGRALTSTRGGRGRLAAQAAAAQPQEARSS